MAAVNVNLSPVPKLQFSQNGVPLAGGLLFTYAAGTMNKQATYTDSTGTAPNTNPVVLDANGQCDCWLQQGLAYKLILSPATDTDPPTNPYWTVDNVHGVNDLVSTYGVDTGVANAYAVSLTPAPAALSDGQVVLFQAAHTNTGASTLNLNGLGAKPILSGGVALGAGFIVAGGVYEVVYNQALASYLVVAASGAVQAQQLTNGTLPVYATAGPSSTPFALRNRIINGNFQINQRGYTSGSALTSGSYAHDRWKAGANGCTYTFTQTAIGQQITITSGSLQQVIEDANIEGGTYTLSWTGTASGSVNGGASSASPITTSGIASAANVTVEFGTGTIGEVQFEPGPTATPFERRPVGTELALCQRYYETVAVFGLTGITYTSNGDTRSWTPWAVFKRATPTVTYGGTTSVIGFTQGADTTNVSLGTLTLQGYTTGVRISNISGYSNFSGGATAAWGDNGNGNLIFYGDAEL